MTDILFLCHSLAAGGIETYILRFSRWAKNTDLKVHVLCKSGHYGTYLEDFKRAGVNLYVIPLGYYNPFHYLKFYLFLKRFQFKAVCDFGGDFGGLTIACAYFADIERRIAFYRNAKVPYKQNMLKKCYQGCMNQLVRVFSTSILSNSSEAFDYYYAHNYPNYDHRFEIVRNGIPQTSAISSNQMSHICQTFDIERKQKIVLHVGSARWEKNHRLIFNIAKKAGDDNQNILFLLVGSDVENNFSEMVQYLSLNNVKFLGFRNDVANLIQFADVFLFPSLSEGQPNALLEAMTGGLPFLASDIKPIRECLPSFWGNRWLFNPGDHNRAYSILKDHLFNNYRNDESFIKLVRWSKATYDESKCFQQFARSLH